MSPKGQSRVGKVLAPSNLYTVILALACCVVFVTAVFVAFECFFQYGTVFTIP